jgi:hypothetical protein
MNPFENIEYLVLKVKQWFMQKNSGFRPFQK